MISFGLIRMNTILSKIKLRRNNRSFYLLRFDEQFVCNKILVILPLCWILGAVGDPKRSQMETILLIDDDPQIISFLTQTLQDQGFQILSCANGEAGLNLLKTTIPDVIIVDAMMPRIDGYQFLWHLKSSPHTAEIPTMMLTSRSNTSDINYGKSLGADVYLTKPFQGQEVIACLNYLLVVSKEARKSV